jgi:hypothetical protein
MSSDIVARLVAVQEELAKIAAELSGSKTPQKPSVLASPSAPIKAPKPRSLTREELEQIKKDSLEAAKAIEEAAARKSEKKRVISDERMAYLKSPEHAAKLRAGREAKKARKNAEHHAEELVKSLESHSA